MFAKRHLSINVAASNQSNTLVFGIFLCDDGYNFKLVIRLLIFYLFEFTVNSNKIVKLDCICVLPNKPTLNDLPD